MSNETSAIFQEIKDFIGFTDEDIASLQAIAPIFAAPGAEQADRGPGRRAQAHPQPLDE